MENTTSLPCQHNLDYKFFCKECLNFLCDKCKLIHLHTNDIINQSFFYSFAKFEIELTKSKIENFKFLKYFNDNIGFENLKNKLIEFYNETVNIENEFSFILDNHTVDKKNSDNFINNLLFNLKTLINEESNLNTQNYNDSKLLEFMKRFSVYNSPFKKLNNIYEEFENSFDNFSMLLQDLLKYQNLKEKNSEKIIIENNSDLTEKRVNEKFEKIYLDNIKYSEEKIKLLNYENEKLIKMNQEILEKLKTQINMELPINNSNNIEINSNKKNFVTSTSTSTNFSISNKDLYNIYTDKIENIFLFFQNDIFNSCLDPKDILEIDNLEMKKFITISYENLITQSNIKSLNLFQLETYESFTEFLKNKQIINHLSENAIFIEIIEKIKNIFLSEISHLFYENKNEIYNSFQKTFFQNYLINSNRIKNLKILDLKSSNISDVDMKRVTDVINTSRIFDIYLQNNNITDKGVQILFNNLNTNRLKNIYINNNNLSEKSLMHFRNIFKEKQFLFENMKIVSFENNFKVNEIKGKEILKEVKKIVKFTLYL